MLPADKVTGIGGFIDAVTETFSVYGGAQQFLLGVMTLCFVGTLLTSGAVWMIGSDRILAVAAYDGGFPGFFGKFNARFGTPVRVNVLSGIVATAFMVVAVAAFSGATDSNGCCASASRARESGNGNEVRTLALVAGVALERIPSAR